MSPFKVGDVVQPNPDIMTTISKYPKGTGFKVLAVHYLPGNDPEGNVDLRLPDGTIEPLFPVSRLLPAPRGARDDEAADLSSSRPVVNGFALTVSLQPGP